MRVRTGITLGILALSCAMARPGPAHAQILEKIKETVESETDRQLRLKIEEAIAGLFQCVWNDLKCIRDAEARGEGVVLTDDEGNVLITEEGEPVRKPSEAAAVLQEAAVPVGTIELMTGQGLRTFQVLEGPVTEGYATGYTEQPVGESMVFGVRIHGREESSGAEMSIQTGVFQESMDQLCDPFSNLIELYPPGERSTRKRLRPGDTSSTTCPENTVDINVTEATFDETEGTLHLKGHFSGPLGRDEEAIQVSEGRFEASIHPFGKTG